MAAPIPAPTTPSTAPAAPREMQKGSSPEQLPVEAAPRTNPVPSPINAPIATDLPRPEPPLRYRSIRRTSSLLAVTVPTVTSCGVQFRNAPSTGPAFKDRRIVSPACNCARDCQSRRSCPSAAAANTKTNRSISEERNAAGGSGFHFMLKRIQHITDQTGYISEQKHIRVRGHAAHRQRGFAHRADIQSPRRRWWDRTLRTRHQRR